jgi:hypothetical protein
MRDEEEDEEESEPGVGPMLAKKKKKKLEQQTAPVYSGPKKKPPYGSLHKTASGETMIMGTQWLEPLNTIQGREIASARSSGSIVAREEQEQRPAERPADREARGNRVRWQESTGQVERPEE